MPKESSLPLPDPDLRLWLVGALEGNLAGCDCPGHPRAGWGRLAYGINKQRLSSEDLVVVSGGFSTLDRDPVLDYTLLESFEEVGIDAVTIGWNEFSAGAEHLIDLAERFSLIGSNLRLQYGERTWEGGSVRLINSGEVEVAFSGIIDPGVQGSIRLEDGAEMELLSSEEVLGRIESDSAEAELLVVGYYSKKSPLPETVTHLNTPWVAILGAREERPSAEIIGEGLSVIPGYDSNFLSRLEIDLEDGRIERYYFNAVSFSYDDPADPAVENRLEVYYEAYASWLNGLSAHLTKEDLPERENARLPSLVGISSKESVSTSNRGVTVEEQDSKSVVWPVLVTLAAGFMVVLGGFLLFLWHRNPRK